VRLTWRKSLYDGEGASPAVRRYRVWRKVRDGGSLALEGEAPLSGTPSSNGPREHGDDGPAWEIVGTVSATGTCTYAFDAPTVCDGPGCRTQFYVSAHTGQAGQHFDSPVDSGYSLDNSLSDGGQDTPVPPDGPASPFVRLFKPEPNPGVGSAEVRFELGAADWVTLQVYDATGRRVASLLDARVEGGSHVVRWDSRSPGGPAVAPGVYFVSLVTRSEVHTAKLLLVR
jgi:hypothetical protein